MALQDLLRRSDIDFPEETHINVALDILKYIHSETAMPVNVHVNKIDNITYSNSEKDEETRIKSITGSIGGPIGAQFHIKENELEPGQYLGIRFNTIPGYEVQEHRDDEVQIWDDTRTAVEWYFKKYTTKHLRKSISENIST